MIGRGRVWGSAGARGRGSASARASGGGGERAGDGLAAASVELVGGGGGGVGVGGRGRGVEWAVGVVVVARKANAGGERGQRDGVVDWGVVLREVMRRRGFLKHVWIGPHASQTSLAGRQGWGAV